MRKRAPITPEERESVLALHDQDKLNHEIARELDISDSAVSKILQAAGRRANRKGDRTLRRINAANEQRQKDLRERKNAEPMAECYRAKARPAAITGADLLLERMKAGAR